MKKVTAEQVLDESGHIQAMKSSLGWTVMVEEAEERIESLTKILIATDNIEKIRDLQANIRSLQFLLGFPEQVLEAARRITAQAPREDA